MFGQGESVEENESLKNLQASTQKDIEKISNALGHHFIQNLESLGLDVNLNQVVRGIQDHLKGEAPPMSHSECLTALNIIQEEAFQKKSKENLQKAEQFLEKNKQESGVIEIEPGKLQYIQLQTGSGVESVHMESSPVIRYSGTFLDGKVLGESQEDEAISMNEITIEGLKKAILGMREGDKRRIFIHPDLGYQSDAPLSSSPNSLLTFDVEIIKANAPKTEEATESSTEGKEETSS